MPFNLEDIINIYVNIEENINLDLLHGAANADQRDEKLLLKEICGYSNHGASVFEEDLYAGLSTLGRSRDFYSKCLIFGGETKKRFEIWINKHKLPDGNDLVNFCWRRFCIVKEACQVIIREEFLREGRPYPDAKTVDEVVTLYRNLVKFKFSMSDFDSDEYPLDTKVENAAEILAILLLYPIDKMVADRARLASNSDQTAFSRSYFDIAENYRIPERYVELFFTSKELDLFHAKVRLRREGK